MNWGNDGYNDFPLPQILSGWFGAALVLLDAPIWTIIVMASLGRRMILEEEEAGKLPKVDSEEQLERSVSKRRMSFDHIDIAKLGAEGTTSPI